jgi:predicted O-methyltransferase YrrM
MKKAISKAKSSPKFREAFLAGFGRSTMNTTPGDAMLLRVLIESSRARRGIEVGVFSGFGAANMGIGFERTGGRLYSLEIDPRRAQRARANLERAGLAKTVTVLTGDALSLIPTLKGTFDFVFIDAAKKDYLRYLQAVEPKLKRGALVVADNVIVCARDMPDFLRYIKTSPDYDTVILRASMEKGDGMSVSYKIR